MQSTEAVLYDVNFPDFVTRFKDNCIHYLVPSLDSAINLVQGLSDPIVLLLIAILLLQLLRVALVKDGSVKGSSSTLQMPAVSKEVRDLKRQIKSILKSMDQLSLVNSHRPSIDSKRHTFNSEEVSRILEQCRQGWSQRQEIALHILDYQTKLMGEVRKAKARSRISSPSKAKAPHNTKSSLQPQTSSQLNNMLTNFQQRTVESAINLGAQSHPSAQLSSIHPSQVEQAGLHVREIPQTSQAEDYSHRNESFQKSGLDKEEKFKYHENTVSKPSDKPPRTHTIKAPSAPKTHLKKRVPVAKKIPPTHTQAAKIDIVIENGEAQEKAQQKESSFVEESQKTLNLGEEQEASRLESPLLKEQALSFEDNNLSNGQGTLSQHSQSHYSESTTIQLPAVKVQMPPVRGAPPRPARGGKKVPPPPIHRG